MSKGRGQDGRMKRGPRTGEGLARCRAAPWKHGRRAAEVREAARLRGEARRVLVALRRAAAQGPPTGEEMLANRPRAAVPRP